MPMNHPDVVSQSLSLSFELKGAAAFILTWLQAFLLLSNEPGASYTCGARVPATGDTYTTHR
jgi:hypothetical protein